MTEQKKNLFVRVVLYRMQQENRTAEDIIQEYPRLTEEEKTEILNAIQQG